MRRKSLLFLITLLGFCQILSGGNERGVWFGRVGTSAGTNFNRSDVELFSQDPFDKFSNINGSINLELGYKTPKFTLQGYLGGSSNYKRTSRESGNIKITEDVDIQNLGYDYTQSIINSEQYVTGLSLTLNPRPSDKIEIRYSQVLTFDKPSTSFIGITVGETFIGKESTEVSEFTKFTCAPSAEWSHKFDKPGRTINVKAGWNYAKDTRYTLWTIGKSNEIYQDPDYFIYRVTPEFIDADLTISGQYRDVDLFGVPKLNLILGLTAKFKQDRDSYSAANLYNEEWKDSTRFREDFDYQSYVEDFELRLQYSFRRFDFDFSIIPEFYSDKLDDSSHQEGFDWGRVSPIIRLNTFWNLSDSHRIGLTLMRNISRPDYLQMCWFRRPGAYVNEIQEGNPDLRPVITNRAVLEYRFKSGRFTGNLELGQSYAKDIIEKTFHKEVMEYKEFRIYTWINAGRSSTSNAKLSLEWRGKSFKASIVGNYNYFIGIDNNDVERRSGDYSISTDAQYDFPWRMSVLAKFRYQSKIIRNYSKITEYIGLDTRISQKFGKKLDVFLEARDLFDRPIETFTSSMDRLSAQIVIETFNRRLFSLGLQFSF